MFGRTGLDAGCMVRRLPWSVHPALVRWAPVVDSPEGLAMTYATFEVYAAIFLTIPFAVIGAAIILSAIRDGHRR
jgi:hypothetical protein